MLSQVEASLAAPPGRQRSVETGTTDRVSTRARRRISRLVAMAGVTVLVLAGVSVGVWHFVTREPCPVGQDDFARAVGWSSATLEGSALDGLCAYQGPEGGSPVAGGLVTLYGDPAPEGGREAPSYDDAQCVDVTSSSGLPSGVYAYECQLANGGYAVSRRSTAGSCSTALSFVTSNVPVAERAETAYRVLETLADTDEGICPLGTTVRN